MRRILIPLLLATALGLAGCERPGGAAQNRPPNVLVIAVDTLRADRLGCFGSTLDATPRLDALAAESLLFERAYAHAPWTLPSFASLMTSQAPPEHGAGGAMGNFQKLPGSAVTLAEVLRSADYFTMSIVNVDFLTATFGLTQGFMDVDFQVFANNFQVRDAAATTDVAITWLGERRQAPYPFFLFVHYFDPHLMYAPPPEYRQRFADPRDRDNTDWQFGYRNELVAYRQGQNPIDAATIRRAEKLYNGEVAYTDAEIGRLLDALDEFGLRGDTVVVFTADHGEEFLDHGSFEHGHTLYNELVHVPLMIRYPGHVQPGRVPTPVGLVDVAPTLTTLAGLQRPPSFVGHDLLEIAATAEPEPRGIVIEGNFWGPPIRGWLYDNHKLIVDEFGVEELYDQRADFAEQHDLVDARPDLLAKLRADMKLTYKSMAATAATAEDIQLSDKETERLRSLGYLP